MDMASWNIPALVNKISEDVPAIKALLTALFKWTDADTTDVPVGAKRLQDVAGGKQMQEYSGSAWGNVGKLMHDVDMLDGKHASTAQTADTIPVRDANGVIPGNVSGNAATATEASSLASGYTVPVANGGTGATTEAGARASLGADNASNINSGILDIAYGGTGSSTKNFVDLTNNQDVGGVKTFSSEIKSTAGTLMSTVMTGVSIADTTRGQFSQKLMDVVYDKDGKRLAAIAVDAETDGSRMMYPHMRNRTDTAWIGDLKLKELADGTVQTLAKTPPAAANDTQIATSAWVRTYCETTKKFLTSHQSLANYLTKTTNVSEMGRYIDMHYDNATSKYDYDVRFQINSQGTAAGGGVLQIVAASVKASKFEGPLTGNVTGNVTGNCSGSSGSCTGNAATATKATKDSANQQINTTYIKALSVSGKTITYTKGDGTTGTITTQDTNTTYSAATQSANGLMSAADKKKLDGIKGGAGNYTLAATWQGKSTGTENKTLTGCTVGQLVIFVHKGTNNNADNFCWIRPNAGTQNANTGGHHYTLGTNLGNGRTDGGPGVFAVIPTATSITIQVIWNGYDDIIYVYR